VCGLLEKLDLNEQAALELLIKEWVASNVIDSACLQVNYIITVNAEWMRMLTKALKDKESSLQKPAGFP